MAGNPHYHFHEGDICDAAEVDKVMRHYDIDTIVNFAAETHVDRSLAEPGGFIQTDVYGTYILLEAAKKYNIDRRLSESKVGFDWHGAAIKRAVFCMGPLGPKEKRWIKV